MPESPELTKHYLCPKCGNTESFVGVDELGYGGREYPPDEPVTLRQTLTVDEDREEHVDPFEGGGTGAEIGPYTQILCQTCDTVIWAANPKLIADRRAQLTEEWDDDAGEWPEEAEDAA